MERRTKTAIATLKKCASPTRASLKTRFASSTYHSIIDVSFTDVYATSSTGVPTSLLHSNGSSRPSNLCSGELPITQSLSGLKLNTTTLSLERRVNYFTICEIKALEALCYSISQKNLKISRSLQATHRKVLSIRHYQDVNTVPISGHRSFLLLSLCTKPS